MRVRLETGSRWARVTLGVLLTAWGVLATGCMGANSAADRQRIEKVLAAHPIHETRMSDQPQEGYVPTGVWRIRGRQNTVYLAGTCHVISEGQIPFPSSLYAAYQDSEEIYSETGDQDNLSMLDKLDQFYLALTMWKWWSANMLCPSGRTLGDYLKRNTVKRLKAFYGKEYSEQEKMTPLGLVLMKVHGDLDGENEGVEDVFVLLARKDSKPRHALDDKSIGKVATEVLEELAVKIKAEIAARGADAVIEEAILDGKKEEVIDNPNDWRWGDMAASEQEIKELKAELSAGLYEKLVPERNRKWMKKLTRMLQGKKNAMVLVGAAHLSGEDGLLQSLRAAGFTPEQMYGVDRPVSSGTPLPAP